MEELTRRQMIRWKDGGTDRQPDRGIWRQNEKKTDRQLIDQTYNID